MQTTLGILDSLTLDRYWIFGKIVRKGDTTKHT